jgi:hypothetical protein
MGSIPKKGLKFDIFLIVRLKFYIQSNGKGKIAFVRPAVRKAPESIDPENPEDVGNADTGLYVRDFVDGLPVGDVHQAVGCLLVVGR